LAVMKEQLQQLAQSGSPQPQATLVLDQTVLTRVRATVDAMIEKEVLPAVNTLGAQYKDAIERRMKLLQESMQAMQPGLNKTSEICRHAELVDA
jgi:hypothetical protein